MCGNYEHVSGIGEIGGVVGCGTCTMTQCFNKGVVECVGMVNPGDKNYVGKSGGLLGVTGSAGKSVISYCYNTGKIQVGNGQYYDAGGIVAMSKASVDNILRTCDFNNVYTSGEVQNMTTGRWGALCGNWDSRYYSYGLLC